MNVNFRPQPDQRSPQEQLQIVLDALGDRVTGESGGETHARCPAHDDNRASLCLRAGDRTVLLNCHAKCEPGAVLKALGLTWPLVLGPGDRTATGLGSSSSVPASRRGKEQRNAGVKKPVLGPIRATYPYRDEAGILLFEVCRYEPEGGEKTFLQRKPDPSDPSGWSWRNVAKTTRRVPYHLPELLARPTDPVYFVEGEKDADNLAKLGLLATTTPQGADSFKKADKIALDAVLATGRTIRIIPDQDEPGRKYAGEVAEAAKVRGCQVEFVTVPPGCKDATDAINAGWGGSEFERAAGPVLAKVERRETPAGPKRAPDGRWIIVSAIDQHARIRADAVRILSEVEQANLYVKGGRAYSVVRTDCRVERVDPETGEVERVGPAARPVLVPAGSHRVQEELSKYCTFRRVKKRPEGVEMVQAELPPFLPPTLAAVPDGLRPINGLFMGPTYCPATDTVISQAGYYPLHAKVLPETVDIRVPETVTLEQARQSAEWLMDLYRYLLLRREEDGRRVNEARILVGLITAVMRHDFKPCPLFLIRAASAGSGKTYLAKTIGIIAHGDTPRMARLPLGTPSAEEEQDKLITSMLDGGENLVVFDNLPPGWELKSTTLDMVLTSESHSMRMLHDNRGGARVGGDNHLMMIATGNNVSPSSDFIQRCLTIDIDPTESSRRTAKETDFAGQGDLIEFVRANREAAIQHVLTIIRGWHQAGRPMRDQVDWGSFSGWVKSCVAPVLWATGINPLDGVFEEWERDDEEVLMLRAVAQALEPITVRNGATATQLIEEGNRCPATAEALLKLTGAPRMEAVAAKTVTQRLKAFLRRPIRLEGRTVRIASGEDRRRCLTTFWVEPFTPSRQTAQSPLAGNAGNTGNVLTGRPLGRGYCTESVSTEVTSPPSYASPGQNKPCIPCIPCTDPAPEPPDQPARSISTPASAIDREAVRRAVQEKLRPQAKVFQKPVAGRPDLDPEELAGTKRAALRQAVTDAGGDRDLAREAFLASGFTKADWDHHQPSETTVSLVGGRKVLALR